MRLIVNSRIGLGDFLERPQLQNESVIATLASSGSPVPFFSSELRPVDGAIAHAALLELPRLSLRALQHFTWPPEPRANSRSAGLQQRSLADSHSILVPDAISNGSHRRKRRSCATSQSALEACVGAVAIGRVCWERARIVQGFPRPEVHTHHNRLPFVGSSPY